MFPFLAPAISALGSKLLGGFLSDRSARGQAEDARESQQEFARSGIRWRVEDAKAAGIHPLYALQGAGATYTPPPISTGVADAVSSMGQDIGRAAAAQMSPAERELRDLQLGQARAAIQKDSAYAALLDSQRKRIEQEMNYTPYFAPPVTSVSPGDFALNPGGVRLKVEADGSVSARRGAPGVSDSSGLNWGPHSVTPNKVTAARYPGGSIAAGPADPFFQEYVWSASPGRSPVHFLAPRGQSPSEAYEQFKWTDWPMLVRNLNTYGGAPWVWDMIRGYGPVIERGHRAYVNERGELVYRHPRSK